jgi:NAD(P)-dependent dehydrogenase (short-subunit alcohol dehydrogenase family)
MSQLKIADAAVRSLSLEGRVAIVTGGASGIGRGIARRLAEMGCAVAIFDKNQQGAAAAADSISQNGGKALALTCDVTSGEDCRRATEQTVAAFGQVDILCNNAGIVVRKDVATLQQDEWDAVLDVTLKSVYLLSHEVLPHMIRRGRGVIINTGSGWSLKGGPQAAAYCAAKAGVLNLTRAMAIDYGKNNIRVNCVCPGDVETPMLAGECRQLGAEHDEFMKEAANRPLGRVGTPEDVGDTVLFLASDMARWITGACLVVDGGGLA